jgi:hypothetical protein
MGFFKEIIDANRAAYRAEREKGKAELAALRAKRAEAEEAPKRAFLARIPYEEQFGVALAAPLRAGVFCDWLKVFGITFGSDDHFPKHLYAISEPGLADEADLKNLRVSYFEITDRESAMRTIGELFAAGRVPSGMKFPSGDGGDSWADWERIIYAPALDNEAEARKTALTQFIVMAAYAITASANVERIDVETALSLLSDLRVFTKNLYGPDGSWEEYGWRFLEANDIFGLYSEKEMKDLRQNSADLCKRPGSPWVNVPFHAPGEA